MSLLLAVFMVVSVTACSDKANREQDKAASNQNSSSKIEVAVSFNAMREFAEAVGKDRIDVKTIIPNGVEPHDFEPKVKDMQLLSSAKVFIYSGLDMEGWVDKTLESLDNKNLVVVEASKGVVPIVNSAKDDIKEHGQYDPHVWVSIKGAEKEADNIKDALIKVDPSNKEYYNNNYKNFVSKLDALYNAYKPKFAAMANKNFVTGHAAFAYFCRDFGLKQNSVESVFADGEPTPKELSGLVNFCRQNNIKTVFSEELASPKVSETLAKEVNANVEIIHTFESQEDNKDYIECMKENIEEVYNSLK